MKRLILGTAQFGMIYGLNNKKRISLKTIKLILNQAKKNNVKFLDTASTDFSTALFPNSPVKVFEFPEFTKMADLPESVLFFLLLNMSSHHLTGEERV